MSEELEVKDKNGRSVRIGSRVRIVVLSESFLQSIPEDEIGLVSSMIGEVFEVDDIDKWGQAWVTKHWDLGNGVTDGHGIGLASTEMELVLSNEPG